MAIRLPRLQELGLVVVVVVIGSILTFHGWRDALPGRPNTFWNSDNIIDGIATPMSYYAIMAVGVTLVIVAGGIDISVASIMTLSAFVTAFVLSRWFPAISSDAGSTASAWLVLPVAFALPMLIGALCGLVNGALVVGFRIHPFIVTLGTMSIFNGITNVLPFGSKTLPAAGAPLPDAFTTNFMKRTIAGMELTPMLIMLIVAMIGGFYLKRLVAGRETYAVGGNEEAARFSGLPVGWIKMRAFILCGTCCGLAGMVSLGRFGTHSTNSALGYELTVIAAAVVGGASLSGGRGTALGALLGTLILAMIENGIQILKVNQEYKLVIMGCAIIVAVVTDRLSETVRERRLLRAKA